MSSILMTTVFYRAVILKGEIWHWSLLGLKGLTENEVLCSQYGKPVTAPNTTKSESRNLQEKLILDQKFNHYYRKINVCFSSKNKTKKFKLISNDRQARI